jgi:hypothetical protein
MQKVHVGDGHAIGIEDFATEVRAVYETLVLPQQAANSPGFSQTLFSYVNGVFARLDLLSAYWRGTERDHLARMVGFMNEYLPYEPEANSVAAQMWRHQAMPTSEPCGLYDISIGKSYLWVIYWGRELPTQEHFQFHEASDSRILSLSLMHLIDDVSRAITRYSEELATSPALQDNYQTMETRLNLYKYQPLR